MNREEAVDKANEIVAEWMDQVKNQRGYVHDKWQPADPAARTEAVLRLAEFLVRPGPNVVPPVQAELLPGPPPQTTLFGWPVGSDECPTTEQYRFAKSMWQNYQDEPNRPRLAAEVDAVRDLIATYERLAPQPGP